MNISSGSPAYPLADSSCEIDYDCRSPSADFNRQSTPVHSCFAFKNPRFSERKSYTNARIPLSVNRAKLNIPYKSELCRLFQMGKCYHGENCHYSHSTSEIRRYSGLRPVSLMDHFNKGRELQECYYFSNGFDCPYGDRCEYIHKCRQKVMRDVGMNREMSAANVPSDGRYKNANNQIPCRSLASGKRDSTDVVAFRKTRLCQKWEMFGSCPYGVRCTYAHGKSELRDPSIQKDAKASEVKSNVAEKLQSKGRSYFNNWDIEKISQIYADA